MGYDLAGKRVLVTGASSGIGAGLAEAFAAAGAVVGICARRRDRLAETLERCRHHSPRSAMWVHDLADPAEVDALAASAVGELGGIDVLVNNAGIPKRRHVTRLDASTVDAVMNINYLSPVRLTLALLAPMLERGHGRIVNVSSVAAVLSSPGEAAYDASKAALSAFSEAMAVDLWDSGVKVLVVYPGVVDTELFTLPDNEPLVASVESVPVSDVVSGVMGALERDAVSLYVPEWFGQLPPRKAADLEGFLAGTAAYIKEQGAAAGS
jgi:NAD(P)-dependent dehydrogenase (short-subunit alcohol dehydrogenase family)